MKSLEIKLLLILLLTVFGIASCTKSKPEFDGVSCSGNCFILSGQFVDTLTKQPLPNVELKFYHFPNNSLVWQGIPTFLGITQTDNQGNCEFIFDASKYEKMEGFYRVTYSKNGYFHFDPAGDLVLNDFHLDSTNVNIPFVQNFKLFRNTSINLHFKPLSTNIINSVFLQFEHGNGKNAVSLKENQIEDTTIRFKDAGNLKLTIRSQMLLKNGNAFNKTDTLTIPAYREKNYDIEY